VTVAEVLPIVEAHLPSLTITKVLA
jgi:hypothetical protein